jgi:hypothetical protein
MNKLEGGDILSRIFRNSNKHTQGEIEAFGGPDSAAKADQYFARPAADGEMGSNAAVVLDELTQEQMDDKMVTSFKSSLTPGMTLQEKTDKLIVLLKSIKTENILVSFIISLSPKDTLSPKVIELVPIDLINDLLRSIQNQENFYRVMKSLPPKVVEKLPMDIIGRRARLDKGGRKSRRRRATKRKRYLKKTLKHKGGKGKGQR